MGFSNFLKVFWPGNWDKDGNCRSYLLWLIVLGGLAGAAIFFAQQPDQLIEEFVKNGGYEEENVEWIINDGFNYEAEDITMYGGEVHRLDDHAVNAEGYKSLEHNVRMAKCAATLFTGATMAGGVYRFYKRLNYYEKRTDWVETSLWILCIATIAGAFCVGISGMDFSVGQYGYNSLAPQLAIGFCSLSLCIFVGFMAKDIYKNEYKDYGTLLDKRRLLNKDDEPVRTSHSVLQQIHDKNPSNHGFLQGLGELTQL